MPVLEFQILAAPSCNAVSTEEPAGDKTAERTGLVCPAKVVRHSPVLELQMLAVRCNDAVSTEAPSGDKTADITRDASSTPDTDSIDAVVRKRDGVS